MAISSVQEIFDGRNQITRNETVSRTRVFHVVSTVANEDEDVVEAATTIPRFGDTHPTSARLYVSGIDSRQSPESRNLWTVTVSYEGYRIGGEWGEGERVDPLDMLPKVRWSTIKSVEAVDTDIYGNAIVNSAYEDYDPPLQADRSRIGCVITRYVALPNVPLYSSYADSVNSDTWRGFPPGTVRVDDIQAEPVRIVNWFGYQETWSFIILKGLASPDMPGGYVGHQLRVADKGKRRRAAFDDGTYGWTPIVYNGGEKQGDAVTEPVPLDGQGNELAFTPVGIRGMLTVWNIHEVYPYRPFGPLNLG